jgi:ribonucleoside-diphosphate reductase alpha chain
MTIENLREYTHFSKYSLFDAELGRKETKKEAGSRMFGMHREKYSHIPEAMPLIDEAERAFDDDLILGSQRALQYGGAPALKKNARVYNCTVSYCDRPRFFQEAFWLLLCGCGTGFSMQKHHVAELPPVFMPRGNGSTITHQVADTIEGWADAVGMLMSSYFSGGDIPFPEAQGRWVDFDYSLIRPEGAKLSSGAGKAPGPEPLRAALEAVREILTRVSQAGASSQFGVRLRPIDAYDIMMFISDAVLSGGVRRSASICLFSHTDKEMLMAKSSPTWHAENPQRQNSNNSALLLRGEVSREEFHRIKDVTRTWGEPGFVWTDNLELLVNPCVEIGMWAKMFGADVDFDGNSKLVSGWQFCNLSVVNMAMCHTPEIYMRACRAASIIGTLQAGYTDFDYLGEISEEITRREALIGVSMTGMADNPDIAFDYDLQERGARTVMDTNEVVARIIRINPAARGTCIKPEGTSSCFLGTASGIHDHPSRRFFRNVTAKSNEGAAQHFMGVNPEAAEASIRNPDSDLILSFMVELPAHVRVKDDTGALGLLERVRRTRLAWVEGGRRKDRCTQPWLSNNVSNTVNLNDNEWDEAFDFVYDNRESFAGVAMLSAYGDLDYAQAPFQSVMSSMELEQAYSGYAIGFAREACTLAIEAYGDLWTACRKILTEPVPMKAGLKQSFFREFMQLAYDWLDCDIKETTYMMKRVYLSDRWNLLQDVMVDVDYTLMTEDDGVRIETIQACAGGACEI